jgi:transcriptional regulator with GAF, ATPase, and Fis domain
MTGRITVLPDDRLVALRGVVESRMQQAAEQVCAEGFNEFFDEEMRHAFCECLARCGAHEGSVWLLDEERSTLVPRFNNGPNAASFVGSFRQPLSSGIISAVVATEQPMFENDMQGSTRHDPALQKKLGVRIGAMLAVPFYFAGELRGVLSAVQIASGDAAATRPAGFSPEALDTLQMTATVLARLLERRLLGNILGLEALA